MFINPTIAISSCLVGKQVRYDGREKLHAYIALTLPKFFHIQDICPEVEIGLSVPRPPMHLLKIDHRLRAVAVADASIDFTEKLTNYARSRFEFLKRVDAYIFKSRSPSCGINSTPVENETQLGSGIFAQQILQQFSAMPVIDELLLDDINLRDQFLESIYCYSAWRQMSLDALPDKKQKLIETYGMRWSMRSGKNLRYLDLLKPNEFQTEFFRTMNHYLSATERVQKICESMNEHGMTLGVDMQRKLSDYASIDASEFQKLTDLLDVLEQNDILKMSLSERKSRLTNG